MSGRHEIINAPTWRIFLAIFLCAVWLVSTPLMAHGQTSPSQGASEQEFLSAAQSGKSALHEFLSTHGRHLNDTAQDGSTMLQLALTQGRKRAFLTLLRSGADPAQTGFDGDTVIHDAARHRDPRWLKMLLKGGADPNVHNIRSGSLPLHQTLIADRERQFEALLEAGADPNLADRTGNTALHVAAQTNRPWRVLRLLYNPQIPASPALRNAQNSTFQRYLFMTDDHMLTEKTRAGLQAVLRYLRCNNIAIDPAALSRKK